MIQLLATRYLKKATLLFLGILYLELTMPLVANAFFGPIYYPHYGNPYYNHPVRTENQKPGGAITDVDHKDHPQREFHKGMPAQKPQIGGPGQPEMSSFKSVNANDMVDLFTGDFSYNIPLMDVGGYPVNIHYNSSVSMDQEASWVGLGWNLNPGTISRSMRGLPDDFNGTDTISKTQSVKENRTVGVTLGADVEWTGTPIKVGLEGSFGIFHNTYNGWGSEVGFNASISAGGKSADALTAGLGITSNSQNGLNLSPSLGVKLADFDKGENNASVNIGLSTNFNSRSGLSALQLNTSVRLQQGYDKQQNADARSQSIGYPLASISFAVPSYTPTISMPFTSTNYAFRGKVGTEFVVLHPAGFLEGYVSKQMIATSDQTQRIPAVGFLYYTKANDRNNVLLDFNREKELNFNAHSTPNIAIPQYTYDVYSISGEGTGGMFRPYRGDVGYIRDYTISTKSKSDHLSVDVGFGNLFHGGVDFAYTNSYTQNNNWTVNNDINSKLKFRESDTTYQAVYFRNPGEKTINAQDYYGSVGDDALMRVDLTGSGEGVRAASRFKTFQNGSSVGLVTAGTGMVKKSRDKRSQVISYLTAQEASLYGLDKSIVTYSENSIPTGGCNDAVTRLPRFDGKYRKAHHISEITVLNNDGRRYVYGIPAYNIEQKDVTFSVNSDAANVDATNGLVSYQKDVDNNVTNQNGKEGLFSKDSMPAYAHSFLLSGILSPDYVDVRSDGITPDDIGDAVKFNYSQIYSPQSPFEWRTPYNQNKANYNEGLKTYNRDDKGTYMYGKKEVWYLNSIESKTMVAVFKISRNRQDIYSVLDENGGLATWSPLRQLDSIMLFAKADLAKNGTNAIPIKTVHFKYSYTLCKGVAGDSTLGKLTLDSLWFTYNGNNKGKQNPYVFRYHSGASEFNPKYQPKSYDRWGNYKDPSTNPGGLSNVDYPYAEQNKTQADKYAAAWTMDDVQLPSGGHIKVSYEADDYAYVQNKRAARFFKIAGISNSPSLSTGRNLYTDENQDNFYVFIKSPVALSSKTDIYQKFLEGNDYFYFKIFDSIPADRWGKGHEFIPVYAKVSDYDIVPGTNTFWLKLKDQNGKSPLASSAIQFLRLNLPSKAYQNSEPGDNVGVWEVIKMAGSSFSDIKAVLKGFDKVARQKGLCQIIDTTRSFVRLNCPDYFKYGGGLRVKRIQVYDNWNQMTGQKESVYGQDYFYTTSIKINDTDRVISSGVASYEPMIGAEENPFRQPVPYEEKLAPLAPVNNMFSENPFGESYFPAASVGYSKVRVRTINTKTKSANGWQETEFYTTKDFPTIVENTVLDESAKKEYNPKIRNFLRINALHQITLSQGFKIELNDMNGKTRAQSSYAETDSLRPISYVRNFYKVDNDSAYQKHLNNTVWVVDSLNGHINQNGIIGKDIEVIQDMREQSTHTIANNLSVNVDASWAWIFPLIIPTSLPLPQKEVTLFRSAATVKVIQRYGILDSVVAMDKGSIVKTKNLLYDGETGEVVLSRTNNEFNDPVYNFSYPAHWAYSGMGPAYKNLDARFANLRLIKGKLYYGEPSIVPFPVERFFESGDEVILKGAYRTTFPGAGCLFFLQQTLGIKTVYFPLNKAWVIDASKGNNTKQGLYFMDSVGHMITGKVDSLRILRSGKRNMLDASVGSIVLMNNPIQSAGTGNYQLVLDSTSRVINTSAVTYKDFWQTENSLYAKDTVYKVYRTKTITLNPQQVTTKRLDIDFHNHIYEETTIPNSKNIAASFDYIPSRTCVNSRRLYTKSILTFDFSSIPEGATILDAEFYSTRRLPRDLWYQKFSGGGIFCPKTASFDWKNATSWYNGKDRVYLKRMLKPWKYTDSYLSSSLAASSVNAIYLNDTTWSGISCTSLIQDVINNGNYGLLFEIDKRTNTVDNYETNYLNLCAGNEPNVNHFNDSSCGNSHIITQPQCDCSAPSITITYTAVTDSAGTICKNYINDSITNPYKWGMLGNWRVDRAYTYYHDRKESDASLATTDIRKEGELKSFSTYWKFTASGLTANADTTKWVWNSASSIYNKKGFEIENYDPLGRYNAGLYGYNNTLPIAVAQNSRYRELLYDGFEDYNYSTKSCANCEPLREYDFVLNNTGVSLSNKESHTGRYSMKVTASSEAQITVPLVTTTTLGDADSLLISVDSTAITNTTVVGKGNGLTATYTGLPSSAGCSLGIRSGTSSVMKQAVEGPIDYLWSNTSPVPGMCQNYYDVTWKGKIQAPYTDNYRFFGWSDKVMQVYVNGVNVVNQQYPYLESAGPQISLQAGVLYDVVVKYSHTVGAIAFARLRWNRSLASGVDVIPKQYLYRDSASTADTAGSVTNTLQYYCIQVGNPKPVQMIRPTFSPLQNTQLTVSAWVKLDGDDCTTVPAPDSVVTVTFYNKFTNAPTAYALQKTGTRIEGWQRYERTLSTLGYGKIKISALAPSGQNIYVDDIRVQPFNSSMKSYVYDPVSLRLMAELDENNYATFYEYDDDGTLIRVKKETERGVMTIKESRSALVKSN